MRLPACCALVAFIDSSKLHNIAADSTCLFCCAAKSPVATSEARACRRPQLPHLAVQLPAQLLAGQCQQGQLLQLAALSAQVRRPRRARNSSRNTTTSAKPARVQNPLAKAIWERIPRSLHALQPCGPGTALTAVKAMPFKSRITLVVQL